MEKLLMGEERMNLMPILYSDIWKFKKDAEAQIWTASHIDMTNDRFDQLGESEQNYLKMLLAFFSVADGIVNENLSKNFLQEVKIKEIEAYYNLQTYIEGVHEETYGNFLIKYIKDPQELLRLQKALQNIKAVKDKAQWAIDWIDSPSFVERIVAFACVEGLSFQSTFAGIFFFRNTGLLPGLCAGNEYIMRDENSHCEFAIYLYNNYIENKLPKSRVREIVLSCLETEKQFVEDTLGDDIQGLNKTQMIQYIQYVADTMLIRFGLEPEFNVDQPFQFMETIVLPRKTNFFEQRSTHYTLLESTDFSLDADF